MRWAVAAFAVLLMAAGRGAPVLADQEAADIQVTLGQYYLATGDTAKALESFANAIDEDSEYAPAYLARAQAWQATGEFGKAIDDISHVMELGLDRSPYVYSARAAARAAAGDQPQAIADYDHALSLNPGFWPAIAGRGIALVESGQHARALVDLDRAIASDPKTIKETLAAEEFQVLARKGPGGRGTRTLTVTIRTESMRAAAELHRGIALLALGRCSDGQKDLRRFGAAGADAISTLLERHRAAIEAAGCKAS